MNHLMGESFHSQFGVQEYLVAAALLDPDNQLTRQPLSLPALTKDARLTRNNGYRFFWSVTDNPALKEAFKDAIRETVFENNEFLYETLVVAMADDAMIYAMDEGTKFAAVDQKRVLQKARMTGGLK